jgi:hypothetical protein
MRKEGLDGSPLHNPLTKAKKSTDLGGELPITLRASISMLSVLLLVNDSELDDAGGSIDVRCVLRRLGRENLFTSALRKGRCKECDKFSERKSIYEMKRGDVMRRARASKTYLKPLNGALKGADSLPWYRELYHFEC